MEPSAPVCRRGPTLATVPETGARPPTRTCRKSRLRRTPRTHLWKVSRGDHFVWIMGTLDRCPRASAGARTKSRPCSARSEAARAEPAGSRCQRGAHHARAHLHGLAPREENPGQRDAQGLAVTRALRALDGASRALQGQRQRHRKARAGAGRVEVDARALDISKLSASGDGIEKSIIRLARKHDVKVRQTEVKIKEPRARRAVRRDAARAAGRASESIVERLEHDMDTMKAQANAWAMGDVATPAQAALSEGSRGLQRHVRDFGGHEEDDPRRRTRGGMRQSRRRSTEPGSRRWR